jgi:hypothetical protein
MLRRVRNGYMSFYTEKQLTLLFEEKGFACTGTDNWRDQKIFVFKKSP